MSHHPNKHPDDTIWGMTKITFKIICFCLAIPFIFVWMIVKCFLNQEVEYGGGPVTAPYSDAERRYCQQRGYGS